MTRRWLPIAFVAAVLIGGCGQNGQRVTARSVAPQITTTHGHDRFARLGRRFKASASAPDVGEVLTTTNGTWSNSPTGYAYQWKRCASSCTNIAGATSASYTVVSTDVGDTIEVVVTASNAAGSASQTSAQTGTVSTAPAQTTGCFNSPGACGFPDPAYQNVGLTTAQCNALPTWTPTDLPSGDYYYSGSGSVIDLYGANVTITGYQITGWQFIIQNSGDVFNGDCISYNGQSGANNMIQYGSSNGTSDSNLTVENSDLFAQGCSITTAATAECDSSGVVQQLAEGGNNSTFNNDILVGAIEDIGVGSNNLIENNYIDANGYQASAHTEDTYSSPGTTGTTWRHNTMLNPFTETAEVFIDNGTGACTSTGNTITDNLMAGGGFMIYACSGATGTYPLTVTNNDLARCGTTSESAYNGGSQCSGNGGTPVSTYVQSAFGHGADSHGYWPNVGYFGVGTNFFCGQSGQTWSGNYYDDTGATAACP